MLFLHKFLPDLIHTFLKSGASLWKVIYFCGEAAIPWSQPKQTEVVSLYFRIYNRVPTCIGIIYVYLMMWYGGMVYLKNVFCEFYVAWYHSVSFFISVIIFSELWYSSHKRIYLLKLVASGNKCRYHPLLISNMHRMGTESNIWICYMRQCKHIFCKNVFRLASKAIMMNKLKSLYVHNIFK